MKYFSRTIAVRHLLVAALAVLSSLLAYADEPVAESLPVLETPAPVLVHEWAPSPAATIAAAAKALDAPIIKPADKPKIVKKTRIKASSMLSRAARNQMALLAAAPRSETPLSLPGFDDSDDDDAGISDLDLHRSYHRPRVVKVFDPDDDEGEDLSEPVKLRLFMARMRAVEAHRMAQAAGHAGPDEGISETVKLRLLLARRLAVEAHRRKFS